MGDNIGLSDNGDFRRVLLVNNMEYENDSNYYYLFKQDYKMKVEGAGFWDKITYLCESNSEEEIYSSPTLNQLSLLSGITAVYNHKSV